MGPAPWSQNDPMALRTAFTELMGVRHPIALAPMSGTAGGALAAAVSNVGGLGLVGGGRESVGLGWSGSWQVVTGSHIAAPGESASCPGPLDVATRSSGP